MLARRDHLYFTVDAHIRDIEHLYSLSVVLHCDKNTHSNVTNNAQSKTRTPQTPLSHFNEPNIAIGFLKTTLNFRPDPWLQVRLQGRGPPLVLKMGIALHALIEEVGL
jgi:hypothetical protein